MPAAVKRTKAKAKPAKISVEDLFFKELTKDYKVVRGKVLEYKDEAGDKQSITVGLLLPEHALIVEIQKKQDNAGIIAEIAKEKVARANGLEIFRFNEKEVQSDLDGVLYRLHSYIQRRKIRPK